MVELATNVGSDKVAIDIEDYVLIRALLKRIQDVAPGLSKDNIVQQYLADFIENKARYVDALLTIGQKKAAGAAEGDYGPDLNWPEVYWIRLKSSSAWHVGELSFVDEQGTGGKVSVRAEVYVKFLDGDGDFHLRDELNIDTMVPIPPPAVLAGAFCKGGDKEKT